jgi:archaeal type IV pilus assembly protein PilA
MKTLRKIRKNAKALSPVVASIILIAVTVAVSIAVAAWMGALTIGFMNTEELKITNVQYNAVSPGMVITLRNSGSSIVTVQDVYKGSLLLTVAFADNSATPVTTGAVQPGGILTITCSGNNAAFVPGTSYQFKVVTAKGNPFVYTATAPS